MRIVTVCRGVARGAGRRGGRGARAEQGATKERPAGAGAAAKAVLDKLDAAFNAGDAKALDGLARQDLLRRGADGERARSTTTAHARPPGPRWPAKGGHMTPRRADHARRRRRRRRPGTSPTTPSCRRCRRGRCRCGARCASRACWSRKGKEWKVTMAHVALVQPEPTPTVGPAPTPPSTPPSGRWRPAQEVAARAAVRSPSPRQRRAALVPVGERLQVHAGDDDGVVVERRARRTARRWAACRR